MSKGNGNSGYFPGNPGSGGNGSSNGGSGGGGNGSPSQSDSASPTLNFQFGGAPPPQGAWDRSEEEQDSSGDTFDQMMDAAQELPKQVKEQLEAAATANAATVTPPTVGRTYFLSSMTPLLLWPDFTSGITWQPLTGTLGDEFKWVYRTISESELATSTLTDSLSIAWSYSEASPLNSNYSDGQGYAMNIYAVEPPYPYGNTGWGIFFNTNNEPRHYGDSIERDGLRRKNGAPEDLRVENSEDREYIFNGLSRLFQNVNPGDTRNARATYKKIMMDPFRGEELFSIVESEQLQYSVTGPLAAALSAPTGDSGGGY